MSSRFKAFHSVLLSSFPQPKRRQKKINKTDREALNLQTKISPSVATLDFWWKVLARGEDSRQTNTNRGRARRQIHAKVGPHFPRWKIQPPPSLTNTDEIRYGIMSTSAGFRLMEIERGREKNMNARKSIDSYWRAEIDTLVQEPIETVPAESWYFQQQEDFRASALTGSDKKNVGLNLHGDFKMYLKEVVVTSSVFFNSVGFVIPF